MSFILQKKIEKIYSNWMSFIKIIVTAIVIDLMAVYDDSLNHLEYKTVCSKTKQMPNTQTHTE